ncbi:protein moonraker isoform X3 [Hyperolius riggenbachi]|uniref:protein moonraker isoform X3 n=1 Tax=Hyperolius riggenbachi TaxID=752182 RepID=UPI0035A313D3
MRMDVKMALGSQVYPRSAQSGPPGTQHYIPLRGREKDTQLRFNLDVITHPANLAAQFSNPSPIIIQKLSTPPKKELGYLAREDLLRHSSSSVPFSVVSEERLNLAVQLAKRDVKRKHLGEKVRGRVKSHPTSQTSPPFRRGVIIRSPGRTMTRTRVKEGRAANNPIKHEVTKSGALVYVYTPDRIRSNTGASDSPPTHDPGPSPRKGVEQNEHEVKRLQKELQTYMQKIEELAKKDRYGEALDPLEEARGRIRQQERATRSARMLYVLRQQVKEIQDDLDKLRPQKIKHTKKDLDLLLEDKIPSQSRKVSPNPGGSRSPHARKNLSDAESPAREDHHPPPVYKQKEPQEENPKRVNRRLVIDEPSESPNTAAYSEPGAVQELSSPQSRAELRAALQELIQAGRLKGLPRTGVGQNRNKGVLIPARPKGFREPRRIPPSKRAHFQEKTVAFKLKESHPVAREEKAPWVPPNPTSPPSSTKRANWNKDRKSSSVSPSRLCSEIDLLKEAETLNEDTRTKEASRLAWLESEMGKRMQHLDDLYRKEIAHIQNLREEVHTAKRLAVDEYENRNASREQPKSPTVSLPGTELKSLQEFDSFDGNEYANLLHQDNHLKAMIERMEEIEKYQEAVRQRFHKIVYSDPDFWAQEEKDRLRGNQEQKLSSPHPIRITKPIGQRQPVVDILLEEPLEGDSLQIGKDELIRSSPCQFLQHPMSQAKGFLPITVPSQMLQSIHNYTERYDRHLRMTSHEEVGAFNPWHVSESLAEELINDALNEVAAELHDLCEGYAEAVFTSEFMEPTDTHD